MIFRATHNLFMLVNRHLKQTATIEATEKQLEKVGSAAHFDKSKLSCLQRFNAMSRTHLPVKGLGSLLFGKEENLPVGVLATICMRLEKLHRKPLLQSWNLGVVFLPDCRVSLSDPGLYTRLESDHHGDQESRDRCYPGHLGSDKLIKPAREPLDGK